MCRTLVVVLAAVVAVAAAAVPSLQPEQVHLSLISQSSSSSAAVQEYAVTWVTQAKPNRTFVQFTTGYTKETVPAAVQPFNTTGTPRRTIYTQRASFQVVPGEVTYRVGCDGFWSDWFEFQAVPSTGPMVVAFYGDMGLENAESLPLLEKLAVAGDYDLVLHVGDFAYDLGNNNSEVGDAFMRAIQPIASRIPYQVIPGNHEHEGDDGEGKKGNFNEYQNRFTMPNFETSQNMYWSFDAGLVHFVGLTTEFYAFPDQFSHVGKQFKWLEEDLKAASENREHRPWIVLMGHRPMYCSDVDRRSRRGSVTSDCNIGAMAVRDGLASPGHGLEKLLHKYGVDVYLAGHMHSYERLYPVYRGQVSAQDYNNPKAPVHIISGSAGCKEKVEHFDGPHGKWSAFRSSDYGFGMMQVHNATHMTITQTAANGTQVDEVTIVQAKHGPF